MDARAIPYREAWDVIGAFDVLEHIREDDAVIRAVHAALRPGGGFLLTVPQHPSLWSQMDELACHQRRYRAEDLHRQLHQAGFQIRRSSSFVTLLLPLMMLARRRARTTEKYDPMQELQIAPWLNRCLEYTLKLERRLIRAGVNLPIGGSRLILAIKPRA
jgi:SAM-dependent methyltransferase